MNILITGACGFIGYNLSLFLLKKKINVFGIDNINSYYSVKYKKKRLNELKKYKNFKFFKLDISNYKKLKSVLINLKIDQIINLAAQAGVRYSFVNPRRYIQSNIVGFSNILEISRNLKINKIIYGSSSSVYGNSKKLPISENEVLKPISTYSLTKKNNEELAKIYSNLYGLKTIGLRFFTVYGEWGRPDMFLFKFLNASFKNKIFKLYNYGNHKRDFTYIDDVVKIIYKLILNNKISNDIFNVSAGRSTNLINLINEIKKYIKLPKIIKIDFQKGDVKNTHGSNHKIKKILKIKNFINYKEGLKKTIFWYKKNQKLFSK